MSLISLHLRSPLSAAVIGTALSLGMLGGCDRCQADKPPPPLDPPATPDAQSEPAVLVLEAGPPDAAEDADAEAGKKVQGKPGPSLKACCAALAQNAENAPEPTKSYMKTAAAACYGAVAQNKDNAAVLAVVRGALGGAGMPAACR
jgi:hypothetical protein